MVRRRFLLIGNPLAGRGRTRLVDQVMQRLRDAGASVERAVADCEQDALLEAHSAAHSGSIDALIAAGGDGTLRLAAKAVIGSEVPIGLIPLGTGNVLAHELQLPRDAETLALSFTSGQRQRIHTATANGELFLLMAGIGFDGRVIAALDHGLKQRLGKLAYAGPAIAAMRAAPDRLEINIDGQSHRAAWAIFANSCHYGGGFRIAACGGVLRPGLQAVLFSGQSMLDRARALKAIALGSLDQLARHRPDKVAVMSCTSAIVRAAAATPVQLDGDAFGHCPVEIKANGPALDLLLPGS